MECKTNTEIISLGKHSIIHDAPHRRSCRWAGIQSFMMRHIADHIVGQAFNRSWCATSQIINVCTLSLCVWLSRQSKELWVEWWRRDGHCVCRWRVEVMINACNSRRVWSVALAHHERLNLLFIASECCLPLHLKLRFLKAGGGSTPEQVKPHD